MRALVVHHDANSSLGLLAPLLAERGVEIVEHFICRSLGSPEPVGGLPTVDGADLLILLGSRWSVYDDDTIGSWIRPELDLVRATHDADTPILGICFGGQALSAALGGTVEPGPAPDIGWTAIESDHHAIETGPWFQWHFDVFTVPPDASELARSWSGPQAFRLGRSVGVQFHPELDDALLDLWIDDDRDQLIDSGIDPDELIATTRANQVESLPNSAIFLDWFLDDVVGD